ncbi:hypothetical protein M885DRAFT_216015 [Pelagophyceae sp. CCMP2097]|nr:hypothetical protein M885DRAFT_216015 [Pelagophyceae sp. CCMP2097]
MAKLKGGLARGLVQVLVVGAWGFSKTSSNGCISSAGGCSGGSRCARASEGGRASAAMEGGGRFVVGAGTVDHGSRILLRRKSSR